MNQQQITEIHNAYNRITNVTGIKDLFLQNIRTNAIPENLPTKVIIDNERIIINCFGNNAIASPRCVSDGQGMFFIEYVFFGDTCEDSYEIWRFYISPNNRICENTNETSPVCDVTNPHIAYYICSKVMLSALHSPMFQPFGNH